MRWLLSGSPWLLVVPGRVHAVPSWSCFSVVLSVRLGSTLSPCSLSLFYLSTAVVSIFLLLVLLTLPDAGALCWLPRAVCRGRPLSRGSRRCTVCECVVRRRKPRGACSGLPAERRGVWLHSRIRRLTRLTFAWRRCGRSLPPPQRSARARMPREDVALPPPRPRGRIYEAARMLHASARFKAHAGEYLRGLPPQVGLIPTPFKQRRQLLLYYC